MTMGVYGSTKFALAGLSLALRAELEMFDIDAKRPGDPAKGAQVIVQVLTKSGRCAGKAIPGRMLLGNDAVKIGDGVLDQNRREFEEWAALASSTD
ncbi:hypothetical protein PR003_g16354 [Phytophthora rubi]|uniref:Uncharacterized protein n=3 Tax=Phytophthora TaxID=4783 RepID=A0A6A4EQB7_9STRA|nr:hypothetical protein PR003_g16354 [Phytophthora rubi]